MTMMDTSFAMPQETASSDTMQELMSLAQAVDFRTHKRELVEVAMLCGETEPVRRSFIFWRYETQAKPTIRLVFDLGITNASDNSICILVHEFGLQAACLVEMCGNLTQRDYQKYPLVCGISCENLSSELALQVREAILGYVPS